MPRQAMKKEELDLGECISCSEKVGYRDKFVELDVKVAVSKPADEILRELDEAHVKADSRRERSIYIHLTCLRERIAA